MPDRPGALVVSLDFELHWGMRDHVARGGAAFGRLIEARRAVDEMLELFTERHIRATWATVGFLFAATREELEAHRPALRPSYSRQELDPYSEEVGPDEEHDPEHLAGSLVARIARSTGQEVGSHTFSHYYCLEAGQDEASFRADLAAARSIAHDKGLDVTSLVLPRNQWNPRYERAMRESGFRCVRGPQRSWAHQARPSGGHSALRRAGRMADTYGGLTPPPTTAWREVLRPSGLCDIPASAFLRPFVPSRARLEPLRLARVRAGLRHAARRGEIFHLWWHPHNFSQNRSENLAVLERVLDEYSLLAETDDMQSLTMADVAAAVAGSPHA